MNTSKELNYKLYTHKEEGFIRTDIKSEFSRYDDIKFGNVEKVKSNFKEIRKDYYKGKGVLSTNPVRNNIYHLVVSAGIIARVCVDEGMPHDEAYTLSDIYIRRADISKTPEEVIDLIEEMQIDFASRMREQRKINTFSIHVRHAIDYIYDHLNEPLTMKQLADIEKLNPSYFSKLFSKETGDNVKSYILKAKLTTARHMLADTDYNLADIAISLGFSSQSAFTAAFRKEYNCTPGKFRNNSGFGIISHEE
ncbi:MAG: AraC family transcriptional regulator [Saccharofermentans sp.]|nr:AraC family transcriptional regulator [Saccharofermentans sp.]